jgi:hypothetical protein
MSTFDSFFSKKDVCNKIYPEFDYKLNFDGCSKGNPGLSGAGAVIYHHDKEIWFGDYFVGDNFTRKPPKYERFIRPTGLRFKKANITHPELKTTF